MRKTSTKAVGKTWQNDLKRLPCVAEMLLATPFAAHFHNNAQTFAVSLFGLHCGNSLPCTERLHERIDCYHFRFRWRKGKRETQTFTWNSFPNRICAEAADYRRSKIYNLMIFQIGKFCIKDFIRRNPFNIWRHSYQRILLRFPYVIYEIFINSMIKNVPSNLLALNFRLKTWCFGEKLPNFCSQRDRFVRNVIK